MLFTGIYQGEGEEGKVKKPKSQAPVVKEKIRYRPCELFELCSFKLLISTSKLFFTKNLHNILFHDGYTFQFRYQLIYILTIFPVGLYGFTTILCFLNYNIMKCLYNIFLQKNFHFFNEKTYGLAKLNLFLNDLILQSIYNYLQFKSR